MQTNGHGADRRRFGRRDSSVPAVLVVRGQRPQPCTILNYSLTGALVEVRDGAVTAQMIRLVVEAQGIDLVCQVRHRSASIIGVTFVGGTIERFNEKFKPQSLAPEPPRAKPTAAAQALEPQAEDQGERFTLPTLAEGTFESEAAVTPPVDPSLEEVAPPAELEPLAQLEAVLGGLPEFSAASFRAELSRDGCSLVIYQRMVRRGHWYVADTGLVWIPATFGIEDMHAASVDVAALRTMQLVLQLIERRHRGVGSRPASQSDDPAEARTG